MNTLKKRAPRWKREQKKRVKEKKKSSVYIGLGFIFSLLFLVIFILQPSTKRIVRFLVPLNTMVQAPFGFGEYQLGYIYKLGKLEDEGGRLLMRTVENNFAVSISGFKALGNSKLTWWDSLRVGGFGAVGSSSKTLIDLLSLQTFDNSSLADGTSVFRIKTIYMDELINHELFDEKLLHEEFEIGVINSSEGAGVASNVSRIIRNIGGDVTLVSNSDSSEVSRIQVKNSDILKSYTVEVLSRTFDVSRVEVVENSQFRADVVVIIGKDYLSLK